ncbi:SRPBCC domain-containing protein [Halobacillus sp. Marseille-Q1614]|uniref:SRPBCC domain-containing protein n=1 Tax=Halobacillus sp. Marseille-Q1614 TaxID=2709134 RepID=UPI0015709BCB|nr:SRPBCC domain-containing protein [Halobacillus sp. Marseille-Q1614]
MSQEKSKMIFRVEGREIVVERTFKAPRNLVFKAYSDPEHLANWWGPEGWNTEIRTFDFEPGGVWHYCMTCVDKSQGDFYGQESWGKAVFKEIQDNEKIVYLDFFSDEEGNTSETMPEMKITVTFIEMNGHTKVEVRSEFATEEELEAVKNMGAVEGFGSSFDRLDEYLQKVQQG